MRIPTLYDVNNSLRNCTLDCILHSGEVIAGVRQFAPRWVHPPGRRISDAAHSPLERQWDRRDAPPAIQENNRILHASRPCANEAEPGGALFEFWIYCRLPMDRCIFRQTSRKWQRLQLKLYVFSNWIENVVVLNFPMELRMEESMNFLLSA